MIYRGIWLISLTILILFILSFSIYCHYTLTYPTNKDVCGDLTMRQLTKTSRLLNPQHI